MQDIYRLLNITPQARCQMYCAGFLCCYNTGQNKHCCPNDLCCNAHCKIQGKTIKSVLEIKAVNIKSLVCYGASIRTLQTFFPKESWQWGILFQTGAEADLAENSQHFY